MFEVIEDLSVADKLAEVGLLWYTIQVPGATTVMWGHWPGFHPSAAQESHGDYTFYILLEE